MSQLARQSDGDGSSDTQLLYSSSLSTAAIVQPSSPSTPTPRDANAVAAAAALASSPSRPLPTLSSSSNTATATAAAAAAAAGSCPSSQSSPPHMATSFSTRSLGRLAPSPLHTTTFVSNVASVSPSPTTSDFPSPLHGFPAAVPQTPDSDVRDGTSSQPPRTRRKPPYFQVDKTSPSASETSFGSIAQSPTRIPDDGRCASDPVIASKPTEGSALRQSITMAGPRVEAAKGAPRNSSIDSAISAMSSSSSSLKNAADSSSPADIANLIKAAGSAEAVIQYLLKEKNSQAQQNAQLWRLVDKQRAMILGLNKDLERALKDKEKYRKKLKEVVGTPQVPPLPPVLPQQMRGAPSESLSRASEGTEMPPKLSIPVSPTIDSDSIKHSPVEVALAPYPITPPADHPMAGIQSAVGDLLDPMHLMPKPEEHALDQFNVDQEEHDADLVQKEADELSDLPINLTLPPSRTPPSAPPRGPPPRGPPPRPPVPAETVDDGLSQFPRPPGPPPRRPPPAPLQLQSPIVTEGEASGDSDLDGLLGAADDDAERRGRRRTRREDDQERVIIAQKEAEIRSLSKKSRKSSSSKSTPMSTEPETASTNMPASPRSFPACIQAEPASLAGVLNGGDREVESVLIAPPKISSGLPASPRPFGNPIQTFASPPLSPRGQAAFSATNFSPRAPRQPIPLPNSPQPTPPTADGPEFKPKPLNLVRKAMDALSGGSSSSSPTKMSRDSPIEPKEYTGFITDEYPDLLIPPNALPSVDIKVASSRMKPSRASLLSLTQLEEDPVFTLAIFSRADGQELWRVEKDSFSLAKLDQRLKQCPAFTAKTPDRSLFSGHAPAKLDARRLALDQYLDDLLNTPLDTATAVELCKYLSTNTLPPNADETGAVEVVADSSRPLKTGPGGRPFRNGYLTKRGKNFGGWKARFFCLEGPQLRYYETPGGAHLGAIKLQNAQIGKQSQSSDNASPARSTGGGDEIDNQYRHAFLILEPKKKDPSAMTKHVLCAESDKERDLWVDALLRWIDYREPDDEEASKKESSSQSQGASASSSSSSKKKKSSSRQEKQQIESESLIGVNYDTTQQGEAPQQGAQPTRKSGINDHEAHLPTPMGMSSQSAYAISGPRDPQPIADLASWGSKTPAVSALEEKKARKRSFFGFSKARTSSDGNDSLFGGDSNTVPGSSGPNGYSGPIRQVFGAPLGEAVRYNAPFDIKVPLPAVVYRCIQYLEFKNAIAEEGIFRLSGSNVVIKQLRERFNTESDVNLVTDSNYHDIHAIASLLKLYLRELPTTILTRDLHPHFVSVMEMPNSAAKIAALGELVERLPQANATLLRYLIAFLIKIINNAGQNKMTVRNVGIVFSPTLNIPAPVFAMFLQNYEGIFGIDAEQYELPLAGSAQQESQQPRRQQQCNDDGASDRSVNMRPGAAPRQPSLASLDQLARPSTSGTSGSPHRNRLVDSDRQQRNTPTPPPMGQYRNGGTPPPVQQQRQVSYEPAYLAQQGMQTGGVPTALRPAYEGGMFVPSNGFDMTQLHTPTGPRAPNPQYDRPIYEQAGAAQYEGPFANGGGSGKSRRESAVFMMGGGMTSQGSRSRLREETHF
ncbi:hypothetical protein RB597_001035 [Gaeumannomyces tritici]